MEWVLKIIDLQPPAVSRVATHQQIRLSRAASSPILSTSRDGAPIASLGSCTRTSQPSE